MIITKYHNILTDDESQNKMRENFVYENQQ